MGGACARCGCTRVEVATAHAIAAALMEDDLARALDLGLLDADACAACAPACRDAMLGAREERRRALAARERYRARQARLERRARQRDAARARPAPATAPPDGAAPLPPAAAEALARALAKARKPQ